MNKHTLLASLRTQQGRLYLCDQAAAALHGMDSPNVTSLALQLPDGILSDVIG